MARTFFVLSLLCTTLFINAQRFEISVHADPQLTWLTSDETNISGSGSTMKLNTGLEFDVFFMPKYAFSFGICLNNQGGKFLYRDSIAFTQTTIPAGSIVKHNLQYVSAPLGLKLKSEELGYTTFYVHGGLAPLFNLKANMSSEQPVIEKENIRPDINLFSLNFFGEAGIEYRLAGNTAIKVGFRYSAGLTDVTVNDYANNNLASAGLHLGVLF